MEVILGPMLASQPCLHAFWVLTSLHLLSFLLKCFLLFFNIYTIDDIDDNVCGRAYIIIISYTHTKYI